MVLWDLDDIGSIPRARLRGFGWIGFVLCRDGKRDPLRHGKMGSSAREEGEGGKGCGGGRSWWFAWEEGGGGGGMDMQWEIEKREREREDCFNWDLPIQSLLLDCFTWSNCTSDSLNSIV